jgi:uncharacterized C2H2 Zn-finger protein
MKNQNFLVTGREKFFNCEMCGNVFKEPHDLEKHKMKKHEPKVMYHLKTENLV